MSLPSQNADTVVVALGGNALIRPGEEGTAAQQQERVAEVAAPLARLAAQAAMVLTHGNGPQVGRHLLRSDLLLDRVPPTTLELAVAATQGELGFTIAHAVEEALRNQDAARAVVALVTRVRVDPQDPAFRAPSKFVGAFYDAVTAHTHAAALGWRVRPDGDRGWRRVVPSPQPLEVLEAPVIRDLLARGVVVVACGGGGVPVVDVAGHRVGAEAVIDKDRATALLATQLGARRLVILTGVDQVWVGFGRPDGRPLAVVQASELAALRDQGEFPAGSMGPKVEATLRFLAGGGQEVLITSPEGLTGALHGRGGTWVRP